MGAWLAGSVCARCDGDDAWRRLGVGHHSGNDRSQLRFSGSCRATYDFSTSWTSGEMVSHSFTVGVQNIGEANQSHCLRQRLQEAHSQRLRLRGCLQHIGEGAFLPISCREGNSSSFDSDFTLLTMLVGSMDFGFGHSVMRLGAATVFVGVRETR